MSLESMHALQLFRPQCSLLQTPASVVSDPQLHFLNSVSALGSAFVPSPTLQWEPPEAVGCFSCRALLVCVTVLWDHCPFCLVTSLLKLLFHTFDCFLGSLPLSAL